MGMAVREINEHFGKPSGGNKADWRDGAAKRGEVEMLRVEIRECRDLLHGLSRALLGPEKAFFLQIEGSMERQRIRERPGMTPISEAIIPAAALDEAMFRYDVCTLEDLVREVPRRTVASWPGMGETRMARLDFLVKASGLEWADALRPST